MLSQWNAQGLRHERLPQTRSPLEPFDCSYYAIIQCQGLSATVQRLVDDADDKLHASGDGTVMPTTINPDFAINLVFRMRCIRWHNWRKILYSFPKESEK
jgi:hypothetical protein